MIKPYYAEPGIEIYNADCRDVIPQLESVDHVITDPPYDDKETHKKHLSTAAYRNKLGFKGLTENSLLDIVNLWLPITKRWSVFTCDWHYMQALHETGFLIRFGIWRKPDGSPQFTGDRPGTGWEAVAIMHNEKKKRWNRGGKHAFWQFPCDRSYHPTQKPLALYKAFIADFTSQNDLILDPFMGSGTTLRACKDLPRRAIGIELNRAYCDTAIKRLQQEVLPL